jgi:two-component system response regulator YesN
VNGGQGLLRCAREPADQGKRLYTGPGRPGGQLGGNMEFSWDLLGLPQGEFSRPVNESLAYIQDNPRGIQSVTQIADSVGVNYHTLRSRFRRETRLTMEECLIRSRVYMACQMILEGSKQIKEIAWDVGYHNENQLTRATKKYLGLTPQVMRRHGKITSMVSKGLHQAKQLI